VHDIHGRLSQSSRASGEITAAYLQDYYESVAAWGKVVQDQVEAVADCPGCRYVGLPQSVENDIRPTAYAAMVLGFLSEAAPPRRVLTREQQADMRADAIGLLRYLTRGHVANEGACADGTQWGNQWQSALWARAVGFAAWQLWPQLDTDLRAASIRLIEYEADRFIEKPPKDSLHNDTGAEENAWNASLCALAHCMLPDHPRSKQWDTAAKTYMYNTFSVRADAQDESPGDDGKTVKQWVTTVNAHDDFTVENHRLVHVGYLKNSACLLQESATHWLLVDQPVPAACNHHMTEVFELLCSCMNWNGAAIYFAGNDWRIYETQCSDMILYSVLAVAAKHRQAAYLERVALDRLRYRQSIEGGYFNGRRDLEYGGLCATRLIGCYVTHKCADTTQDAASVADFDDFANGVRLLPAARSIVHRTRTKFASFSWAQQRMGLTMPSQEQVIWPHYASYLGTINGQEPAQARSRLIHIHTARRADGFRVTGTLERCGGQVFHDFCFESPGADYTVYVERVRPQDGVEITRRRTGLIGFQTPIGSDNVVLTGDWGETRIKGRGGEETTRRQRSNWLNIAQTIGYVVKREAGVENLMVVQDRSSFHPRRPHLQQWVSLVSDTDLGPSTQWACVVSWVNVNARQTQAYQSAVRFETRGDTARVRVAGEVYDVDFARSAKPASAAR
jgi:hypothetical protein